MAAEVTALAGEAGGYVVSGGAGGGVAGLGVLRAPA